MLVLAVRPPFVASWQPQNKTLGSHSLALPSDPKASVVGWRQLGRQVFRCAPLQASQMEELRAARGCATDGRASRASARARAARQKPQGPQSLMPGVMISQSIVNPR